MDYPYNMPQYGGTDFSLSKRVSAVMKNVYLRMTVGLIITAFVSLLAYSQGFLIFMLQHRFLMWGLAIAEIVLVIAISAGITKMKSSTALLLFMLFAVVNGLSLSPIFAIYTGASIAKTFFICAGTFGAMSIYGYTTKNDLSRMGSILFMALIGLIICTIVNMIWPSDTFGWIISFAGVAIFIGLTAWDTQKIKQMAAVMPASSINHLATLGALSLYLDFINLFIYLLRFFGDRD